MSKQAQIDYFEGLLEKHGANHLALDWNSPESQRLRYKIMKEMFVYGKKASGVSVLDVGCGLGDLYGFFKADGILFRNRINYTGYDISPKLVAAAKKRYPDAKFELKDIMEERYVPKFDYVFCSGIFNIRTSDKDAHLDLVKEMLFRMYDLSSQGLAVNFLSEGSLPISDYDELNSKQYFFFEPEKIMNYARFICSRFMIRHDYHPGDFTVYLLK
ncbi:MAG: class I SAM-dependent methyltransferase [Candidatus Margulisbacteria bacterium]|nr:class I SAM-dependent methyltransferase [Candidatus Margulisiibacteriota bacterium]